MRRTVKIFLLLLLTALVLTGCGLRTVEQLYCLPKRSQADNDLQTVIDEAMADLSYSAPLYGDNRQPVQMADLDGDGVEEYLLFARDNSEKPLKILIFSQLASGYLLMDTIEGYGQAFDFVEYTQMDDRPGMEIVVGRQVSNQVARAVSVYRFTSGTARQLLSTGYSRMTVCDLDMDRRSELVLLNYGSAEDGKISLYSYQDGELQQTQEQSISAPASGFFRFTQGRLEDGSNALFVTAETEGKALVTDIFVLEQDRLRSVTKSITTQTLQGYHVYPTDVDADGILEMARLLPMPNYRGTKKQYLLQWYSLDKEGNTTEKLHTFHNYAEGWYMIIDRELMESICVEQLEDAAVFSVEQSGKFVNMVSIMTLTDADREEQAKKEGRVILYKSDVVIYVADITPEGKQFGITLETLKKAFFPIRAELTTEED